MSDRLRFLWGLDKVFHLDLDLCRSLYKSCCHQKRQVCLQWQWGDLFRVPVGELL